MSPKRGRPISESTEDPAYIVDANFTAGRAREFYHRRRAARATVQPTEDKLQQGERIIELGFTDQDAAETLA